MVLLPFHSDGRGALSSRGSLRRRALIRSPPQPIPRSWFTGFSNHLAHIVHLGYKSYFIITWGITTIQEQEIYLQVGKLQGSKIHEISHLTSLPKMHVIHFKSPPCFTHFPPELDSWRCHNKVPQTGWLKQQKFIFSSFWRLEIWGQDVDRVGFFWGPSPWLVDEPFSPCVFTWSSFWVWLCPDLFL